MGDRPQGRLFTQKQNTRCCVCFQKKTGSALFGEKRRLRHAIRMRKAFVRQPIHHAPNKGLGLAPRHPDRETGAIQGSGQAPPNRSVDELRGKPRFMPAQSPNESSELFFKIGFDCHRRVAPRSPTNHPKLSKAPPNTCQNVVNEYQHHL